VEAAVLADWIVALIEYPQAEIDAACILHLR
jgi:hypothetical protein